MRFLTILAFLLTSNIAQAVELGDDGLHKTPWLQDTFKDMGEDWQDAQAQGKTLMVIWEQRGCIYCTKMHEEVFSDPGISKYIADNYFVVQMNLFGDVEVTDFDGESLPEKEMARKWNVVFTPTMQFFSQQEMGEDPAATQAVMTMPGAYGRITTQAMLEFVHEEKYLEEQHFQKYVADRVEEIRAQNN